MKFYIFISIISLTLNVFFIVKLVDSESRSFQRLRAYTNAIEQIEGLLRTKGKINTAYTCKVKN
jgi:hypothetical protein